MVPDFTALPMGRRESGQTWTLRLHGGHCLVVGASDAGKGSFVQSFMRSVAGGIAAGTVRVVGFDPKGGMEMAGVAPLLARFLCDGAAEMADALEEEVTVLNERTVALRGRTRQHVATVEEPKRIILIDELATLTAYGDKKTTDRVKAALALILTKGRAAGIHVVALVQDGRKEVVPLRNLFAIRVGLRMVDPPRSTWCSVRTPATVARCATSSPLHAGCGLRGRRRRRPRTHPHRLPDRLRHHRSGRRLRPRPRRTGALTMNTDTRGRGWSRFGALLGGVISVAANVAHSYIPRPVPRPTGSRCPARSSARSSGP
ncbi:FtsK/SpoIIIE domain-containing protein [Catellatospora coxensis]